MGFTFTTGSCFADGGSVSQAAPGLLQAEEGGAGGQEVALFEKRIRRLEQEKQELNRKLQGEEEDEEEEEVQAVFPSASPDL